MSENYRNGGTGEEAVTLPNEDEMNSSQQSIDIIPEQRTLTDAFMGTNDLKQQDDPSDQKQPATTTVLINLPQV